jgi:hypothetical protein
MKDLINKLDKSLEDLFKKAPKLPKSVVEILVKIAPWASLVFSILAIPPLLAMFGIGVFAVPWAVGFGYSMWYWVAAVFGAAQVVLGLMAVKPLLAGKMYGWQLLFYSAILSGIASLFRVSLGGLLGMVIGFYLLYQMKSEYK